MLSLKYAASYVVEKGGNNPQGNIVLGDSK